MRVKSKRVQVAAIVVALLLVLSEESPLAQSLDAVSLKLPFYPPIALAARVEGEVHLRTTLLDDGTPGDIKVLEGPQMLRQAAVDNAKGSKFRLAEGSDAEGFYDLTYRFKMVFLDCDQAPDSGGFPHIQYGSNLITITAQAVPICDPAADLRVRSIKCLYLWRCGLK